MNFTNLDQCCILEKMGVDPETADCYMLWVGGENRARVTQIQIIPEGKTYKDIQSEYSSCKPAWSAYALMKLLPDSIEIWDDDAGRHGKKETCYLNIIPGDSIAYETLEMKQLISRPIDKDVIGETILILSTVKKLTKTL